jgi:hypothetical protein
MRSHVPDDNHRAMTMKASQVEATVGGSPHPVTDALPRYTSLPGRRRQRSTAVYCGNRAVDVLHAVDFPGQDITRQSPLASPAPQATHQHHRKQLVLGIELEAAQ